MSMYVHLHLQRAIFFPQITCFQIETRWRKRVSLLQWLSFVEPEFGAQSSVLVFLCGGSVVFCLTPFEMYLRICSVPCNVPYIRQPFMRVCDACIVRALFSLIFLLCTVHNPRSYCPPFSPSRHVFL